MKPPTDKEFISAKIDSSLIRGLEQLAERRGVSRSAALRTAVEKLLEAEKVTD